MLRHGNKVVCDNYFVIQMDVDMAAEKLLCSADLTESPHPGFTVSSEFKLSVQMFCNLLKYESKFSFEAVEAESASFADLT